MNPCRCGSDCGHADRGRNSSSAGISRHVRRFAAEDACQCDRRSGNLQAGWIGPVIVACRFLCSGTAGDPGQCDSGGWRSSAVCGGEKSYAINTGKSRGGTRSLFSAGHVPRGLWPAQTQGSRSTCLCAESAVKTCWRAYTFGTGFLDGHFSHQ